ncbi:MAG: tetratricopeptide repeat protein [Myxococcales bacterium]
MRTLPYPLVLALAVGLAVPARAKAKEAVPRRVQQLVQEMMTDYNTGDFEAALAKATEAYRLKPLTALLFNMGQFHKELKHWERAEFFFKRYLAERPDASNRMLVEKLIAEVEAKQQSSAPREPQSEGRLESSEAGPANPTPPLAANLTPPPPANPPPAPAAPAAATSSSGASISTERPRQRSHILGYSLIAGGVLLAAGAVLSTIPVFDLGSINGQIQSGQRVSYSSAQSAQSNARVFEGVSIGLGVAALACLGSVAFVW